MIQDPKKKLNVPSILVDCDECGGLIEMDLRTHDLAMDVGPGTFRCDDCKERDESALD